jgi:hypothetical protein
MQPMWARPKATRLRFVFFLALVPFTLFAGRMLRAATPGEQATLSKGAVAAAYGELPLSFEVNEGQSDRQVKFLSQGPGYGLFLTSTEAVLSLKTETGLLEDSILPTPRNQKPLFQKAVVLRIGLERANSNAKIGGINELAGRINYFIGHDPAKWRRNIPIFARVSYKEVYPGVDLVYYGNQRELEYDFVLAPRADPRQIELSFDGAQRLRLDADGNLIVSIAGGEVIERKPVIYQDIDGMRRRVDGGYALREGHTVGFKLAGYDHHGSLTIDPSLVYSTYLGGASNDEGNGIAVDVSGNVYVIGYTQSRNFPTTRGAVQTTYRSTFVGRSRVFVPGVGGNAFVTKLNSNGSALLYSTYLGGRSLDQGLGITLDSSGNAYVTGMTSSSNFPTTKGALQTTYGGGQSDAFVSKLNTSGSLVYSTYLGGSDQDVPSGIAVDASGNAYVIGYTTSSNFPTTAGAFQTLYAGAEFVGGGAAFVSKLNSRGSALVYSTFLSGSDGASGDGIALDASGNAYVTGDSYSSDFPITPGAFQSSQPRGSTGFQPSSGFPTAPAAFQTASSGGHTDAFVSKVNAYAGPDHYTAFVSKVNSRGSALVYSTYLGGSSHDNPRGIAVDASGNAYITGDTDSGNFPTTAGAFQTACGDAGFVSKVNSRGSALVYSTCFGGGGRGIAVDPSGNAYVTGSTGSKNFPTTAGAFQTAYGGNGDAVVIELNSRGSALVYSTYLGGSGKDQGNGIALDASGNVYVTGNTASSNFPTSATIFPKTTHGGPRGGAAFVSKLNLSVASRLSLGSTKRQALHVPSRRQQQP